jgi:AAA domain
MTTTTPRLDAEEAERQARFDAEDAEREAKADEFLDIASQRDNLPDDLHVLSVEFEQTGAEHKAYRERSDSDFDAGSDFDEVFGPLGVTRVRLRSGTCFGPVDAKFIRFRVDFIGKPNLLEKIPIGGLGVKRTHVQQFRSLKHLFKECENDYDFGFKECYPSEFANFEDWARAAQVTADEIAKLVDLFEVTGGRLDSMAAAIRRTRAEPPKNTFLVPGLIPDGAPTLLLGNRKAGKSTALLELAVAVARREPEWMGFPLNHERRGLAVYLSGEDSEAEVIERVRRMTGGETPYGLHVIPARGGDLDEIVENMQKENPRLIVIDPARKYFKGDEDGSDAVNDLFNRIEPLVQEKNCTAIVSHHLKRGADPRTVAAVADYVRGSGVWLDRPRVTLGMLRSGDETLFGISVPS